jgi:hypothetical protein
MLRQSTVRCARCQRTGHVTRKCHALLCGYCDKTGHLENKCRILMRDIESGREFVSQFIEYRMFSQKSKKDTRRKSQGQSRENQAITRAQSNANYDPNEINESTVGYYRVKLMSFYKNVLEIKAPELKTKKANMLIDTVCEISLIKMGKLSDRVPAEEEILILETALGKWIKTICLIQLNIQVGNKVVTHPCRVVHDDFYVETDGVLGWDFISKSKINLDYIELHGVKLSLIANELVRLTVRDSSITVLGELVED